MEEPSNKYLPILTIVVFLCLLIFPNIYMLSGLEEKPIYTRHKSLPAFNFKDPYSSISKFKNYYTDNFGLKTTLVNFYTTIKRTYLKENELPNRVLRGKNGWYFLGNHSSNTLNHTFGLLKVADADLAKMKSNLIFLRDYLKAKNIAFYVSIPPNKNTIYREMLPYQVAKRATPLEQFKSILNKNEKDFFIDYEEQLLSNKQEKKLYYKTNSHWNDTGAFIAYKATIDIISKTHPEIKPLLLEEFNSEVRQIRGDIINMINIKSYETDTFYIRSNSSKVIEHENNYNYVKYTNSNGSNLKLLMYRDSFAMNWFNYFPENFKETIFMRYNRGLKKEVINKEKPDIIILEVSERNFVNLLKTIKLD